MTSHSNHTSLIFGTCEGKETNN